MLLRVLLLLLLFECHGYQQCIPVLGFGIMKDVNNFTQRLLTHIE